MSGKMVNVKRVEETQLWSCLQKISDDHSKPLIAQLPVLCQEAADRMKVMPARAPQFTLHDETHSLRVLEIMAMILGDSADRLNPVEVALLILAAYMHDQGMVMDGAEYQALEHDPAFLTFRDNWYLDHPNRDEIQDQFQDPNLIEQARQDLAGKLAELDRAMLTDYLRTTHVKRSADHVLNLYGRDKRLEVCGVNLSAVLSRLCASHGSPCNVLTPSNGFRYDVQVGPYFINEPFLAIVLRLADILDLDADRTPDVLFRTIHFSNPVSLQEWEKHRGIQGWTITGSAIRYSAQYQHPAYQAAALKYMDWIDIELAGCHAVCQSFPAEFRKYELRLPPIVDRSRIEPVPGAYEYHDLEISLSRDEIVKLLMADKLYCYPHLCVRELLQNSLDALRYRRALFGSGNTKWDAGNIRMSHSLDENGYEVLECTDNGVGMDVDVVTRFLTKAGRSYYRSPEFERERMFFRDKGVDFDPCSQFGIGFMSCFMLGDRIKITTRRDYGTGRKWGDPLVVEITGLGSLVVLKKGDSKQEPGTTVTITSRKKPSYLDDWSDQVLLTTVLKGYAIATEFPIVGKCTITEITDEVTIPSKPDLRPTLLESVGVTSILTIQQNFSEIHANLGGCIRESFLIDKAGVPTTVNDQARWVGTGKDWAIQCDEKTHEAHHFRESQIAIDGVLLCGEPGRPQWSSESLMRLGMSVSPIYASPFLLDVRAGMKPEITPARTPQSRMNGDLLPSWNRLKRRVHDGAGRIWEQIADFTMKGLSHNDFWKLVAVYRAPILSMRPASVWQHIAIPLAAANGTATWSGIRDLGVLRFNESAAEWTLRDAKGNRIAPHAALIEWETKGSEHPGLARWMTSLVFLMSRLTVDKDGVALFPTAPDSKASPLSTHILSSMTASVSLVDYTGDADTALAVQSGVKSANRRHPLVAICSESVMLDKKTAIQQYATSLTYCVAEVINSDKQLRYWDKPNRWMRMTAHRYFAVDWSRYDKELQPPYRIWLKGTGWSDIKREDLERWRDAPIRPEERL